MDTCYIKNETAELIKLMTKMDRIKGIMNLINKINHLKMGKEHVAD